MISLKIEIFRPARYEFFVGISALESFDITADGTPDILVGRSNGMVEVYSVDEGGEPSQKFKHVSKRLIIYVKVSFS